MREPVSLQVINWGRPLEENGYEVGDILRVLAAWVFNRFDPADGLKVETWCGEISTSRSGAGRLPCRFLPSKNERRQHPECRDQLVRANTIPSVDVVTIQ